MYSEIRGIFALRFNRAAGAETDLYKLKKKTTFVSGSVLHVERSGKLH